ncbi:MAG: gamma-glutamylcyclotransferase family protein [Synechococcaceae cyanobacterium ELA739]
MPYLFSYGTLQQEEVQLSTFGRKLTGAPDSLVGFLIAEVRIQDPEVVATSGREFHPIARNTGAFNHRVPGTVFEVMEEELKHSDAYEVDAYKRVVTVLASGRSAWVYVEATET